MSTYKISITGIVQGVGFRPTVYRLATRHGLTGYVCNGSDGVLILIQGNDKQIAQFMSDLKSQPPPKSRMENLTVEKIRQTALYRVFSIKDSKILGYKSAQISPDLDVCDDCLMELFDTNNRRYLYPFINCTACGPRFTITTDVPYDRKFTTMSCFTMCTDCQSEYEDPVNRRFHAQPNACPICGPKIYLYSASGKLILTGGNARQNETIFLTIAQFFREGKIIAVKGIGGFHLACDAANEESVSLLRHRKYREDKPFAVMVPDLTQIRELCEVSSEEERLLESHSRPIVLLRKRSNYWLAMSVAPENHFLGVMLPYTPLHYLLFHFYPKPLVMTSGNICDEPIVFRNEDAFERLSGIADFFLIHDRDIHMRCDDSVYRIFKKQEVPIRRSRGFAPESISVNFRFHVPVLACGAEQKNTFALAKENRIFVSHHVGDMENIEVLQSFSDGIQHYKNVFDIEPEVVTYDLHPDYLSTKYALDYPDVIRGRTIRKIGVQHHHAHAVSCMAENHIDRTVLAIVLDGTGYGNDGTIWGGEVLLTEYHQFKRVAHFRIAGMPGCKSAIKHPWQMAMSYLYSVYGRDGVNLSLPFLKAIPTMDLEIVLNMLENQYPPKEDQYPPKEDQYNIPITSSCGRLFDGMAAIAGVRNHVNYEGQAAIEFEQKIEAESDESYHFVLQENKEPMIIDWQEVIIGGVTDVLKGASTSAISVKFHNGLANALSNVIEKVGKSTEINEVVLSGGVFMNIVLLRRLVKFLENKGFKVYTHHLVPTNDGGISLGQAVIANAICKREQQHGAEGLCV